METFRHIEFKSGRRFDFDVKWNNAFLLIMTNFDPLDVKDNGKLIFEEFGIFSEYIERLDYIGTYDDEQGYVIYKLFASMSQYLKGKALDFLACEIENYFTNNKQFNIC